MIMKYAVITYLMSKTSVVKEFQKNQQPNIFMRAPIRRNQILEITAMQQQLCE